MMAVPNIKEEFTLFKFKERDYLFVGYSGQIDQAESADDPRPLLLRVDFGTLEVKVATSEVFGSELSTLGWVNDLLVADFNNDSVTDIIPIDHGREVRNPQFGGYYGKEVYGYFSNPSGFLDRAEIFRLKAFWHASEGVVDINRDGYLDFVSPRLGIAGENAWKALWQNDGLTNYNTGVGVFINDKKGGFTESSKTFLPVFFTNLDITYDDATSKYSRPFSQFGSATVLENATGVIKLVLSDSSDIWVLESRNGAPFQITQKINYSQTGLDRIGSSTLVDVNQDGFMDVLLNVETRTRLTADQTSTEIVALVQNSAGDFVDATKTLFKSNTLIRPFVQKPMSGVSRDDFQLIDVDLDGFLDLVWGMSWGTLEQFVQGIYLYQKGVYVKALPDQIPFWRASQDDPSVRSLKMFRPILTDLDSNGTTDLIYVNNQTNTETTAGVILQFKKFIGTEQSDTFDARSLVGSGRYFDGMSGIDRVVYQIPIRQAKIEWSVAGHSLTDRSAPLTRDTLNQVERIQFSDSALALDTTGIAGKAYRIYKAAFDRTPDGGGLGYWIAQMDKGMDVVTVAARFIDSPEFRSLYGMNPTDAEFLTKVYSNVLSRAPDSSGLAWWVNEMKTNPTKTWQKVLADFSESTENQANVASLIANGIEYSPWMG
jgi:hypothetical protein